MLLRAFTSRGHRGNLDANPGYADNSLRESFPSLLPLNENFLLFPEKSIH